MGERDCHSAVPLHPPHYKPSLNSHKGNELSRIFIIRLLIFVCLQALLFSSPIMSAAQTSGVSNPETGREGVLTAAATTVPNQPTYSVSVAQLSIPAKAIKHLESAHKHFTKSDLTGAIKEIDQALGVDPDCAQAFSLRAFVKLALKNFDGAIEDAIRAVVLDPHDPESYLALATAYNSAQHFSKAAEAAQQALNLNPDAWQGRLELAKSWYSRGQYDLALNALDRIHQDFPDVHLVRANVLMCLGHASEAAEQFRLFLKQAPDDPRDGQIRRIVAKVGENPPA
jgi:tetratricopeptide (TPR) repeat protein